MPPPALRRLCAACAAPARPPFKAPPSELAPDLDLRPGEPVRSTLPRWILTCRRCRLSAPDLACPPARAAETIATPAYQALLAPAPENSFLRYALLCEAAGQASEAAEAVLQAAWTLDDAGQEAERTAALRLRAARLWADRPTAQDALRTVDLLRRAQAFDQAADQAARLLAQPDLDETGRAILARQQSLIAARDPGRHLLSSALRPPARTPHASHGKPAPRGFWRGLVGR